MDITTIIMAVVLLFLVVLMVLGYLKRKKFNANLLQMREDLKVGDKVMTDTGVVGEIIDKRQEGEFNFVTLKTGSDKFLGYMEVHVNAIYYVFGKDGEPVYAGQTEEQAEEKTEVEDKE